MLAYSSIEFSTHDEMDHSLIQGAYTVLQKKLSVEEGQGSSVCKLYKSV